VPATAPWGSTEVLTVADVEVDGFSSMKTAWASLHVLALPGDVTGDQSYSGLDAALIARIGAKLDFGFDAFPLVDPVLLSDLNNDGVTSAVDADLVARRAVGLPQSIIPELPTGVISPAL